MKRTFITLVILFFVTNLQAQIFERSKTNLLGAWTKTIAVGDINNDGYPDIFYTGWDVSRISLGDGTSNFTTHFDMSDRFRGGESVHDLLTTIMMDIPI